MHVNRIHVPRYCAYEELRAAGDSEIPGPYRHLKIRCAGRDPRGAVRTDAPCANPCTPATGDRRVATTAAHCRQPRASRVHDPMVLRLHAKRRRAACGRHSAAHGEKLEPTRHTGASLCHLLTCCSTYPVHPVALSVDPGSITPQPQRWRSPSRQLLRPLGPAAKHPAVRNTSELYRSGSDRLRELDTNLVRA
jgi:hypothetical protein